MHIVGITCCFIPKDFLSHLFTRCKLNFVAKSPSNKGDIPITCSFYQVDVFFSCPLWRVTHRVSSDRINVRRWRWVDVGAPYWRGLGKIPIISLNHHHRRYLPTPRDFGLKLGTWGRPTDLPLSDVYVSDVSVCVHVHVYTRVIESSTSRWKMSAGVTGIRIRENTSRKNTRLGHRSCVRLLMIRILADIFLFFSLSMCVCVCMCANAT